jgi:hypothetical protein
MKHIALQNGKPLVKKQFLNLSNRQRTPVIIQLRSPIHHTDCYRQLPVTFKEHSYPQR